MKWPFTTKSKYTSVDSDSNLLLSIGSTTEGKERWRAKDLPPFPYVQIHRPKSYMESAQRLIQESQKEDFVTWASTYLSHKDAFPYRLDTLKVHRVELKSDDSELESKLVKSFDRDYFVTALNSGVDTQPGEYRWRGIQQPMKWEAFLLILRALPDRYRSYEDDARLVKDRLVGDSDWGYVKPMADPVATSTRLGDYYKRPGGTITTIDHTGRLWEWTKGAKGFSDEYPGGRSKSGLYAWQLCPGQPEEPKITKENYRSPLERAGLNVRLQRWGTMGFPTSDNDEVAVSKEIFYSVESDTCTSRNPPPRNPTVEDYDDDGSYDNYGEGPSSHA